MRILVVEDDEVLAAALTRALTQSAYAVDHVANGEDANLALAADTYDLVVLDLALPGVDGLRVLRRLRDRRSRIPVLVLSARDALEDRVAGLDEGADDYLTKPFD
ncbi:MAG: response regulator, partial [Burkholderiales bacterium]